MKVKELRKLVEDIYTLVWKFDEEWDTGDIRDMVQIIKTIRYRCLRYFALTKARIVWIEDEETNDYTYPGDDDYE